MPERVRPFPRSMSDGRSWCSTSIRRAFTAGSGRFEPAAVVGVIIAVIALGVTAVAFRLGDRNGLNA